METGGNAKFLNFFESAQSNDLAAMLTSEKGTKYTTDLASEAYFRWPLFETYIIFVEKNLIIFFLFDRALKLIQTCCYGLLCLDLPPYVLLDIVEQLDQRMAKFSHNNKIDVVLRWVNGRKQLIEKRK